MSLTSKKIISILHEECTEINERCQGHREEISKVVDDILQYEAEHRILATNIIQKINERFSSAAHLLKQRRQESAGESSTESTESKSKGKLI